MKNGKTLFAIGAVLLLLCFILLAAGGEESDPPFLWSFGGELNMAPGVLDERFSVYDRLSTGLHYRYDFFYAVAEGSLINDKKYSPAEAYWLGRYWYLKNGGLILDFDLMTLKAGRFVHQDFVDTPYSLFISSRELKDGPAPHGGSLPALLADMSFHLGFLTYESRWIQLNHNSRYGYPERGANYKVFAAHFGNIRFGYQDTAVYVDRSFDLEYFLSPIPHIGTQIVTKTAGKPWAEDANDNSVVGLFFDWREPLFYLYAQWLIDDISLDFLIPEFLRPTLGERKIPQKWAWSLGGCYDFAFGKVGFYHAGATKYTFERSIPSIPYEYAYYPATEYQLKDGTPMVLHYLDNYLGYKYGENNLAFLVDYSRRFKGIDLYASLEYVISGAKSPANPWHEYASYKETGAYTLLLDGPVLEHTIAARIKAGWSWRNLVIYTNLKLGGIFNELQLEEVVVSEPEIFRPQAGRHRFLYEWAVGIIYVWKVKKSASAVP